MRLLQGLYCYSGISGIYNDFDGIWTVSSIFILSSQWFLEVIFRNKSSGANQDFQKHTGTVLQLTVEYSC